MFGACARAAGCNSSLALPLARALNDQAAAAENSTFVVAAGVRAVLPTIG